MSAFDEEPPQQQPRPPSPHAVDHLGLLDLVRKGEFSHQTTLRTLRLHPEWLCAIPSGEAETPLHAVVRTGNLRLLEMLLSDTHLPMDLDAPDTQGQTVLAAARAGKGAHPKMAQRVEDLRAFEAEAHALAADKGRLLGDQEAQDRLVAALTRRLDWISAPHHKAWAVLHHLVHHGDVALLERVVGIPGAFAAIKLRARTRDCRRTVVELATAGGAEGAPMAAYLRDVLGPMFGLHFVGGEAEEAYTPLGAAFPRARAVAAANVKVTLIDGV